MRNWSRDKNTPTNGERLIFRIDDLFFWIPQQILIKVEYKTAHKHLSVTSIEMAIDYYHSFQFRNSLKLHLRSMLESKTINY